jgi:hypothetical protein
MNFRFYILGVPDGFDLFPAIPEEIQYFQGYYDGSEENAKLTIQRRGQQISYSYLRYNLISGGGRGGAFFGMSAVFDGMYCSDVTKLYRLFEAVFGTILENGILLKAVENNQTMFGVGALKDAANEINRVESIIRKNLDDKFTADFQPFDPLFRQEKMNMLKRLDIANGNTAILAAMQEYPRLSISPEYKEKEFVTNVITQEELQNLETNVKAISQAIDSFNDENNKLRNRISVCDKLHEQEKRRKEEEIVLLYNELTGKINEYINLCSNWEAYTQQFLKNQPRHDGLLKSDEKLKAYYRKFIGIKEVIQEFKPLIEQIKQKRGPTTDPDPDSDSGPKPTRKVDWQKLSPFIAGVVIIVIIIGLVIWITPKDDSNNGGATGVVVNNDSIKWVAAGDAFRESKNFDAAIEKYGQAGRADLVEDVKKEAITDLLAKAGTEKKSAEKIALLEKAKGYGYANADSDIEDIKKNDASKPPTPGTTKKAEPAKPSTGETKQPDPKDYRLSITNKKDGTRLRPPLYVKAGDKLQATINPKNADGEWGYDNELISISDTKKPVLDIDIKFSRAGRCELWYKVNGKKVAAVTFFISPKAD